MYYNKHLCTTKRTQLFSNLSFRTEKVNFSAVYYKDIQGKYFQRKAFVVLVINTKTFGCTWSSTWISLTTLCIWGFCLKGGLSCLFLVFHLVFYMLIGDTITVKSRLWPSQWLMPFSKLSNWNISRFILQTTCVALNQSMRASYKHVFYTSTQTDWCNTQCHQQRLDCLCHGQTQILLLSTQSLTLFVFSWVRFQSTQEILRTRMSPLSSRFCRKQTAGWSCTKDFNEVKVCSKCSIQGSLQMLGFEYEIVRWVVLCCA